MYTKENFENVLCREVLMHYPFLRGSLERFNCIPKSVLCTLCMYVCMHVCMYACMYVAFQPVQCYQTLEALTFLQPHIQYISMKYRVKPRVGFILVSQLDHVQVKERQQLKNLARSYCKSLSDLTWSSM